MAAAGRISRTTRPPAPASQIRWAWDGAPGITLRPKPCADTAGLQREGIHTTHLSQAEHLTTGHTSPVQQPCRPGHRWATAHTHTAADTTLRPGYTSTGSHTAHSYAHSLTAILTHSQAAACTSYLHTPQPQTAPHSLTETTVRVHVGPHDSHTDGDGAKQPWILPHTLRDSHN